MSGQVYLFRSLTERKVYVGQTMQVDGERWQQHVAAAFCGSTNFFHQAIRRLGASDFTEEILATATTRSELNELEQQFIAEFKATDAEFGYNTRIGGGVACDALDDAIVQDGPERMSVSAAQFLAKSRDDVLLPLFNCYGERLGSITVSKAREFHGIHLEVRAKGTGRRRRFTSAKLFARTSMKWAVVPSGGYSVLQLVNADKLKKSRRRT